MKILVIDDNPLHREAAKAQLAEHDLTIVDNYDEARKLILNGGFRISESQHSFDVVLTDLLMPVTEKTHGNYEQGLTGQEMPLGIFLALLAIGGGAKYVGLITDANHHKNPLAACLDDFEPYKVLDFIPETKVIFKNYGSTKKFNPKNLAEETDDWDNYVWAKDWVELLNYLLET